MLVLLLLLYCCYFSFNARRSPGEVAIQKKQVPAKPCWAGGRSSEVWRSIQNLPKKIITRDNSSYQMWRSLFGASIGRLPADADTIGDPESAEGRLALPDTYVFM